MLVVHDKVYNATSFIDEHPYVPPLLFNKHKPGNIPRNSIITGREPLKAHHIPLRALMLT